MAAMGTELRIGTWNLDHARGVTAKARRIALLAAMDADIWVLTETNDDHAPEGFRGAHSAPRDGSRPGGRWVSIWSRLPILEVIPVADANRTVAALIDTPLGRTVVFGTVLPWHSDRGEPPSDPPPRNWQEQDRVTPLQGAASRDLRHAFPDARLCVAGDLNMNLGGPHLYGTARGRGLLTRAMEEADLACLTSFDRVPAGALKQGLIDHILFDAAYAERAEVVATWEGRTADGARLSDHSGAVVALRVPGVRPAPSTPRSSAGGPPPAATRGR